MTDSHVSRTVLSEPETADREGMPAGSAAVPLRPESAARPSAWTAGRITAVVIGVLLVLASLGLLSAGGAALWFDRVQRDAGYVTSDVHEFSTAGSALATEPTDLGSPWTGWLYSPALLDSVRIRVTPDSAGPPLFVGIGPSADVDRYLAGVNHTVISDFWTGTVQAIGGATPGSPPGTKDFWVVSTTGAGVRNLAWDPTNGSWTVVVMNADGRPGIDVRADLGASVPALPWIAAGLLAVGAVLLVGGTLLIRGAIRRRPETSPISA